MVYGLPDRLKSLRQQHGLTQEQLAARIDVSTSIISAYETGGRSPSIEKLVRLVSLYQCSADYLLGISNLPPVTHLDIEGLKEPQIRALQLLIDSFRNEQ